MKILEYERLSREKQINFLCVHFNLSRKEAEEIVTDKVKDLPNEIKGYFT